MGDVTSTCCQNTTHMQEMNITREINTGSEQQQSVQNYTFEPFHQPSTDIKNTIKQAAQSSFFKYSHSSISFQNNSQIWNQKNIVSIVKKVRLNPNNNDKGSIFDMISLSDSGKFCTYVKSLSPDNNISEQQEISRPQQKQPLIHTEQTVKVLDGLFLIHFPGKQYYLGHIRNNSPTNGIFVFKHGCYYVGNISELTAEGQGMYENKQNGYVYEGKWSKNLQHGKGKQVYLRNGDKFQGQFMYGSKFGEGKYTFNDGRVYEGYFYNGHSDGQGRLTINPKQWYKGEWKLGSIQGKGEYHYLNGDVYFGQFQNGLKSGKGRYVFSAGYEYDGEWMQGKMHGFGIIKEGYDQIQGQWVQGRKVA